MCQEQWEIKLASVRLKIGKNINWRYEFKDNEDVAALHRFIWLYNETIIRLENNFSKAKIHSQIIGWIISWIEAHSVSDVEKFHAEVFQTYTVGERIVNWLYALSVTSDDNELKQTKIYNSIVEQTQYICENLEYYGDKFTGNHLLENGKAIYIAGMALDIDKYKKIGKEIILNERKRILINAGFLREGSIHYQFLITKNFVDIYWTAQQFGDLKLQLELASNLKAMAQACKYFQIENSQGVKSIPYIGDISPDYRPDWIIETPQIAEGLLNKSKPDISNRNIGYHSLFFRLGNKYLPKCSFEKNDFYNLDDWGKIDNNNWILFAHVNRSLYPNNLTGHFHHDTGAIVLYYKGICVLCDCGRKTYELTKRGRRDKGIEAHCGIMIDAIQPEPDMRTFYSDEFLKKYVPEKPRIKQTENFMEIYLSGYNRLKDIKEVKRIIWVKENYVKIIDSFKGSGKHAIKLFFHVDGNVQKLSNGFSVKINGEEFSITFNYKMKHIGMVYGSNERVEGKASEAYGESKNICSVICEAEIEFPFQIETQIVVR